MFHLCHARPQCELNALSSHVWGAGVLVLQCAHTCRSVFRGVGK